MRYTGERVQARAAAYLLRLDASHALLGALVAHDDERPPELVESESLHGGSRLLISTMWTIT